MNKVKVRFFSIGMLVAVIIISLYGFFFEENTADSEKTAEKDGYTLVEKDRLDLFEKKISNLEAENAQLKKTIKGSKNKTNSNTNTTSDQVFMFEIREGMSLEDIARGLQGIHIISDQKGFTKFMVQNGYEKRIQPREYEFKPGMSNEEIAKMITK